MGDSVIGFFAGVAVGLLCMLWHHIAVLRTRLARVEGKLDALLKNANVEYDPFSDIPNDVADAIRSGNKMLAIKLYREATGSNLRDAKELIEDLLRCTGRVADAGEVSKILFLVMPPMLVCSALGAIVPLLIWRPDPGSHLSFVPALIGGVAGAFIGLIVGVVVLRLVVTRGSRDA